MTGITDPTAYDTIKIFFFSFIALIACRSTRPRARAYKLRMRITIFKCIYLLVFRLYICALVYAFTRVCVCMCVYVDNLCEGYPKTLTTSRRNRAIRFIANPYRLATASSYRHRRHRSRSRSAAVATLSPDPDLFPLTYPLFSADTPASGVFRLNGAFRSVDPR